MMLPASRCTAIHAAAPTYSAVPTMMSVMAAHCEASSDGFRGAQQCSS
jgi:hypothetical protein